MMMHPSQEETFNRILAWTVAVCISEDTHSHLPFVFPSENANHMVNTQLCSECLSSECPNDTGAYGCPYSTIYEIPEWYDIRQRYGYEHLPRSLNAQGWTFENTGCQLYGLGLKHLYPATVGEVRLICYEGSNPCEPPNSDECTATNDGSQAINPAGGPSQNRRLYETYITKSELTCEAGGRFLWLCPASGVELRLLKSILLIEPTQRATISLFIEVESQAAGLLI
ncbi:hypothetical protein B0H11DRAFT_1915319 [Mycena galericulata]|nr:hypothetical protein B0H11DRAFT_1915319 [Mycena galericulata]